MEKYNISPTTAPVRKNPKKHSTPGTLKHENAPTHKSTTSCGVCASVYVS